LLGVICCAIRFDEAEFKAPVVSLILEVAGPDTANPLISKLVAAHEIGTGFHGLVISNEKGEWIGT